jgi:hypothetical protein
MAPSITALTTVPLRGAIAPMSNTLVLAAEGLDGIEQPLRIRARRRLHALGRRQRARRR